MRKKRILSAVAVCALLISLHLPEPANALSSSEIRRQINVLKEEKKAIQEKIKDVQTQYEENENEIANIISRKNVIDQQIQLLYAQISNINDQISAFKVLIADKQDELDSAYFWQRILRCGPGRRSDGHNHRADFRYRFSVPGCQYVRDHRCG